MTWIVLALVVWIVCGVFAYGFTFAYWQQRWPDATKANRDIALTMAVCGPMGLLVCGQKGGYRSGLRYRAS